ncbi:hypothetical protein B0T26DRAFT_748565 [Lasiosphaeria miniovina]|uniref:Tyrosinase copper-binding domain-containing protein n=1 Tax=Lasiosphaeria miniovina TaxID=1954250 RepID=A0AA40E7V1_9PEZI|nr:uncharacterized protein B0T26DRAFT_748565 [Lasiosphaeria miniovina]KAK0728332.1 hypothetical protein B0T26DRAFT_748565 [Lasiosphaeria miniovina]
MAPLAQLFVSPLAAAATAVARPVAAAVEGDVESLEYRGSPQSTSCRPSDVMTRKSWHTLSNKENKAYLDAESAHVSLTEVVHYAGQFLPYHPLSVFAHEEALRRESDRGRLHQLGGAQGYGERCLAKATGLGFWVCVEASPHTAGHAGIGLQMTKPMSSPGNPLFYLHHAYLDMLWTKCRAQNPSLRLTEMGGPDPSTIPNVTRPYEAPVPIIIGGPANVTTLNHVLQMHGLTRDRHIREIINTKGFLCYGYDQ